jgi:hypothetical protein
MIDTIILFIYLLDIINIIKNDNGMNIIYLNVLC